MLFFKLSYGPTYCTWTCTAQQLLVEFSGAQSSAAPAHVQQTGQIGSASTLLKSCPLRFPTQTRLTHVLCRSLCVCVCVCTRVCVGAHKGDKVYVYWLCKHSAATLLLTGQRAKSRARLMAIRLRILSLLCPGHSLAFTWLLNRWDLTTRWFFWIFKPQVHHEGSQVSHKTVF